MKTTICGIDFYLHPSGALYWPDLNMLLIADVHLGKVSHFRKAGMAVPEASVLGNFKKLDMAVNFFEPEVICFLGDLFHSELNREWLLFSAWARSQSAKIILVSGNHDIIDRALYMTLSIDVVPALVIGGLLLTHHPYIYDHNFNICGHVHPCVTIRGPGRQRVRLPCFFHSGTQLILPAFGTFTGMYELFPAQGDSVYVLAENEVLKVN